MISSNLFYTDSKKLLNDDKNNNEKNIKIL